MPDNEKPHRVPQTPEGAPNATEATAATGKPETAPETPKPEPNTAEAISATGSTVSGTVGAQSPARQEDVSASIIGIIFWLIILGVFAYWFIAPHNRAQVFIQTSPQSPGELSGMILFKGTPVSKGTVYLLFEDPRKGRYLASIILPVIDGTFNTSGNKLSVFEDFHKEPQPLRVTATFTGQQQEQKKDKAPTAPIQVTGTRILYVNYPAAAGKLTIWSWAIISGVFSLGLISLFTGVLTRRKAQFLFWITYIMSFMSLALPIWAILAVSRSQYAVEMMEEAPIGLIKGTARGVQRPQWIVNIGGAVVSTKTARMQDETVRKETVDRTLGNTPTPDLPSPTSQESPAPRENTAAEELRPTPGFAMVQGGLAVPFYVIILAMLGAGINMTKKVPGIQQTYDTRVLPRDRDVPLKAAAKKAMLFWLFVPSPDPYTTTEQRTIVSGIRMDLIALYMGLISAPFLAIAVYYLLQVIATNIAEPVLVVISFATGFVSDSIVAAITKFAKDMLDKLTKPEGGEGQQQQQQKPQQDQQNQQQQQQKQGQSDEEKKKALESKPGQPQAI